MKNFPKPLHISGLNIRVEHHNAVTGYIWGKRKSESNILKKVQTSDIPMQLDDSDIIAERWFVSDDMEYHSYVLFEGKTVPLPQLLTEYGTELLGTDHLQQFGPFLGAIMKHIDTNNESPTGSLSVQVHPALGHPSRPPKPELWKGEGKVYIGWKEDMSPELLRTFIETSQLTEKMHMLTLSPDMGILVQGGMIHAIRSGSSLYEWSVSPTEKEKAFGSLKTATVSPYDRTDGKVPRPGKENIEGTIDVLNHAHTWHHVSPKDMFAQTIPLYRDSVGNSVDTIFETDELSVFSVTVKTSLEWEFPKGMSFFIEKGMMEIGGELFEEYEEGFLPFTLRNVYFEPKRDSACIILWCRKG